MSVVEHVTDGTSLTETANKVVNENGKTVVFANAQANDIYRKVTLPNMKISLHTSLASLFICFSFYTLSALSALSLSLHTQGYKNIFGVGTPANHYVTSALFALRLLGAQTAAILYDTSSFTSSRHNCLHSDLSFSVTDISCFCCWPDVLAGAMADMAAMGVSINSSSIISYNSDTLDDITVCCFSRLERLCFGF